MGLCKERRRVEERVTDYMVTILEWILSSFDGKQSESGLYTLRLSCPGNISISKAEVPLSAIDPPRCWR